MNASINSSNTALISKGEITGFIIRALCLLLGMCGNITVVVVLVRNIKKKNFTLQLMLNLAASDILCLAMLPVWMCNLLFDWTIGFRWCRFFIFVTTASIHASVFIVTLMSLQRYVVVLYRTQWSRLGRRGEHVVLVFVWVLAGALAFSPAATYGITHDRTMRKCEQVFRTEVQKVGVLLLETMVLLLCHSAHCWFVTSVCTRKLGQKLGVASEVGNFSNQHRGDFFVFWIPYHIINVMVMVTPSEPVQLGRRATYRGPRQVAMGIVFFNSCVNPLLYAFNYRSLRAENAGTDNNTT